MPVARNQTTAYRRYVVAAALALSASFAKPPVAFAKEPAPFSDTTLQLDFGVWVTGGIHSSQHNSSVRKLIGYPISKLAFDDAQTLITMSATAWPWRRWFLRTEFGASLSDGSGTLTDDDFVLGAQPVRRWSRTTNSIGTSVQYMRFGVGHRLVAAKEYSFDVFGGLQFWLTRFQATGLYQLECDRAASPPGFLCAPAGTRLRDDLVVLHRSVRWVGARIGVAAHVRVAGPLAFDAELALIPIDVVQDDDIHRLRYDLRQNPSSRTTGVGISGDLETGLSLSLNRSMKLSAGYRLWATTALDADKASYGSDGWTLTLPISELFTIRHGATMQFRVEL